MTWRYAAKVLLLSPGFLNRDLRPPLESTERFIAGHEQRLI